MPDPLRNETEPDSGEPEVIHKTAEDARQGRFLVHRRTGGQIALGFIVIALVAVALLALFG